MRILNRYIIGSFYMSFLLTLLVVTFVMCIGVVFKVTDLIVRGVPWRPIVRIFLYGLPEAMSLSIPVSLLTGCLLSFGRLSADSEITAMKASGVSMKQIITMPCWFALVLSIFCVYLNNELVPRGHFGRRDTMARLGVEAPLQLLEVGRYMRDFPGWTVYIGRRHERELSNVRILDLRKPDFRREIRATRGVVREATGSDIIIDLFDVRVNPLSEDNPMPAWIAKYPVRIENALRSRSYQPKPEDYPLVRLVQGLLHAERDLTELRGDDIRQHRTILAVELNKRLTLAAACVAFAVLGIPLGIRSHRRESSIGIAISLVLVFGFYVFVLIAEALQKKPHLSPHLIMWLPVLVALFIGFRLIRNSE